MSKVIIEVRGGNVIQVYASNELTQVSVIDWDNVSLLSPLEHVADWMPMHLSEMPIDTKSALKFNMRDA